MLPIETAMRLGTHLLILRPGVEPKPSHGWTLEDRDDNCSRERGIQPHFKLGQPTNLQTRPCPVQQRKEDTTGKDSDAASLPVRFVISCGTEKEKKRA
jgi:hypothetical protein